MAETLPIPVTDLLIDVENPRLPQPNVGQREAQQELARHQQTKLLKLAQDIVEYGLSVSDLPIVMQFKDDSRRYVMLEGNRRLVALKALENPDSMVGAVTPSILNALRKLSAEYHQNPIESITCSVVKNREEARHWIELRHAGELEGAGIVRWASDEKDRFRARTSGLQPQSQALNFLEEQGYLTPEKRKDVPTTSLKRLLSTPEVRKKLGVDIKDKQLVKLGDDKQVAKALLHVVDDLASGKTKVEDIYTKQKRIEYANNLPASVVVTQTAKGGHGTPVSTKAAQTARRAGVRIPRQREKLIPRDCVLNITDPRLRQMEIELRRLSLDDYPNAVSVLFRVFVELSADAYISREALSTDVMASLSTKLQDVANDLVTRRKLTAQQARPVRRAAVRDSFLAPSITLLHGYVHNQHFFPAPSDLRAHWDSLQPFFIAIWSV